jgi:hypothetical protein
MSLSDKLIQRGRVALRNVGLGQLVEPEIRRFPEQPFEIDNEVARLFHTHDGRLAAKWDHYHRVYDRYFSRFRGQNFKFLEIGVSHGGSVQVWRKYFGPAATIFGIDVDKRCAVVDDPPSINIRIGSQADLSFLRSVVEEMGGVDVVLDDGSHWVSHQRASFEALFPVLSPAGIYIVEDLHTNYWRGMYEGGWKRRSTFIEQMKDVVDDLHGWWHTKPQRLAGAHQVIEAVHFYDSMVVIEKRPKTSPFSRASGTPSF